MGFRLGTLCNGRAVLLDDGLVESGANMVWLTSSPGLTAEIMGGAAAQGFVAVWSGNSPSYNPALLASPLAPYLEANFLVSTYNLPWGSSSSPGMVQMEEEMLAARPDSVISDAYVIGWLEGMAACWSIRPTRATSPRRTSTTGPASRRADPVGSLRGT